MRLLHVEDVTAAVVAEAVGGNAQEAEDIATGAAAGEEYTRHKKPNFNFTEMNIPPGSVLKSVSSNHEVTVIGPRKVKVDDKEMYLAPATKLVLSLGYNVAPCP